MFFFRCIVVLAVFAIGTLQRVEAQAIPESTFDRVLRTKTIRAAWLTYPPAVFKDESTGKLTGTFVETLEKVAHNLELSVVWDSEETPWSQQFESLDSGKCDVIGSPVWANPKRGKLATLSNPVYYSGIGLYVRSGDVRFPDDWKADGIIRGTALINKSDLKIAVLPGETGEIIAKNQFPEANRLALPDNASIFDLLSSVASDRTDLAFVEPYFANEFVKSNPGKLRNIASHHPVRVLGNVYMFRSKETQMKQMFDVALEELQNDGFIEGIIKRYENAPGVFLRASQGFSRP